MPGQALAAGLLAASAFVPPASIHRPPTQLSLVATRFCSTVRLAAEAEEAAEFDQQQVPGAAVGIDLGTTSSSVAIVRDGTAEVVLDEHGRKTMPSRVLFGPNGPLVGEAAGDMAISSAKRLIGRSYEEVATSARARALFGDQLVALPDGGAGLRCPTSGKVCAPEDVAALVLEALLDRAEAACGLRAQRAVIGVPAHFTQAQRDATRAAAAAAGIDKARRLLEELVFSLGWAGLGCWASGLRRTPPPLPTRCACSRSQWRRRWRTASSAAPTSRLIALTTTTTKPR
jgi:hypothetical protein